MIAFDGLNLLLWLIGLMVLAGCTVFAYCLDAAPLIADDDPAGISRWDALDGVGRALVESDAHEARMTARATNIGMPR
jgi:hypothetical protein